MINGRINVLVAIQKTKFWWVALHYAPESTPDQMNEIAYKGYVRVKTIRGGVDWLIEQRKVRNVRDLFFPVVRKKDYVPATHVAIWTGQTGGACVLWIQLADVAVFRRGDKPVLQKGQVYIEARGSVQPKMV